MNIVVLDKIAMGEDTPFSVISSLGALTCYSCTSSEELIERIKDADVIITNKVKITAEAIRSAKSLKLVCVFATGFDNIDIKAAKEMGVGVANVPGYSTDSVALCTVATVSALYTKLLTYSSYVHSGEYSKSTIANKLTPVYHEISGKTWGIIGFGNIGRAVGKVAQALGARVIVNKRTPSSDCECVDIDTLCRESDIITVHCPLNDSTRGLINETRLSLMKKSAVLVNEARGLVMDEEAVAKAVLNGEIAAFGSDVYSVEPFTEAHPFYKIRELDNVILTPHFAWGAYEARERCISIIAENIRAFFNGERKNRVE